MHIICSNSNSWNSIVTSRGYDSAWIMDNSTCNHHWHTSNNTSLKLVWVSTFLSNYTFLGRLWTSRSPSIQRFMQQCAYLHKLVLSMYQIYLLRTKLSKLAFFRHVSSSFLVTSLGINLTKFWILASKILKICNLCNFNLHIFHISGCDGL